MPTPVHLETQSPCPFLPGVEKPLRAASMKRFGKSRGGDFYMGALEVAQSLWLQGFPAQSLLQINRAMGADLSSGERVVSGWPVPYEAASWVMAARKEEQFIGNPRRHFQHLATRMVEPRRELRTWRAWGCWYLACRIFPDYPADEKQLETENVVEPSFQEIKENLKRSGLKGEVGVWERVATRPFPEG